jgi:amino acid permease
MDITSSRQSPRQKDLPSRIKWVPLRYALGVVVCALVLILAPLLALFPIAWNHLRFDLLIICRNVWIYLKVWAMVTGNIWIGVFTRNNWFGVTGLDVPPKGSGDLPPPSEKP